MEYSLRERVILIAGPFTTTVQSLMSGLTSVGADVALLDTEGSKAGKFCAQLMDQREVRAQHGRAAVFTTDFKQFAKIKESVGSVAQSFGGIDVFIDAQVNNTPTPLQLDSQEANFDELIDKNLKSTLLLTQAVAGFLKNRKKGRIVFLINDSVLKTASVDAWMTSVRGGLVPFSQALAKDMQAHNVTVNVLSLGLTEEYILAHEPGASIKEALDKIRIQDPLARITEPDKITNSVIYLVGPSGAAISGQVIRLN